MDGRGVRRLLGVVLLAGIAVAGCTSAQEGATGAAAPEFSSGDTAGGAGNGGAPAAVPPAQADSGQKPAEGGNAQPGPTQQQQQISQPGLDRKLVRTATMELVTENVVDVTNRARDIATRFGGYAGSEDVKGDNASLTLHIPSNDFDKALGELSGLVPPEGIRSRSQTAADVTEQLVDVESRIATQRTSVERAAALLARAQTVAEIVQIESEVTRRQADLESLEKRREALSGQVALSKVTVRVSKGAPAPAPAPEPDGFLAGVVGGWHAFLTAGGWLLRVIGALLPFVIGLGIPGFYAWRWWNRRRRRLTPAVQQQTGP
jgi:hypothetical protein